MSLIRILPQCTSHIISFVNFRFHFEAFFIPFPRHILHCCHCQRKLKCECGEKTPKNMRYKAFSLIFHLDACICMHINKEYMECSIIETFLISKTLMNCSTIYTFIFMSFFSLYLSLVQRQRIENKQNEKKTFN